MTDPILIKALRDILTARVNAKSQGAEISPDDEEAFVRAETGGKYGRAHAMAYLTGPKAASNTDLDPSNVLRAALNGATFNVAPWLLGKMPAALGGGPEAQQENLLRQEMFKRAHPIADLAANLAGGIATGSELPGAAKATTVGRAALNGATMGGLQGAVAGAGSGLSNGESAKQVAMRAATGGGAGVALGAMLPPVLAGAAAAFNPAAKAARRLTSAIDASGGLDAVRQRLASAVGAGRGDDVMLADLSPHLRAQADFAANNSDGTFIPLAERLHARQADQATRIAGDVRAVVGDAHAPTRADALASSKAAWAGPAYDALRAQGQVPVTPELAQMLRQPVVRVALQRAQRDGLIGATPDLAKPSMAQLLDVRKALQSQIDAAFGKGNGTLATGLAEVRDALTAHLEGKNADFAAVNGEFHARSAAERALQNGVKAWGKSDPQTLATATGAMRPAELEQFRHGIASELLDQLRSTATNRDLAGRIMQGGANMNAKLQAVFGDEQTFDQFMQKLQWEREMHHTMGAVGGSQTARRLAAASYDPAEGAAATVLRGPAAMMHGATHAVASGLFGAARRNTAALLGPQLMAQGAPNIEATLAAWSRRPELISPLLSQGLPGGIAGLLSPR